MPAAGFYENWKRSFALLLTDGEHGLNLRNDVGHGLSDCSPRPRVGVVNGDGAIPRRPRARTALVRRGSRGGGRRGQLPRQGYRVHGSALPPWRRGLVSAAGACAASQRVRVRARSYTRVHRRYTGGPRPGRFMLEHASTA